MTRYVGPRCRARELSGSAAAAANKRRAWTTSKMNGRRAAVTRRRRTSSGERDNSSWMTAQSRKQRITPRRWLKLRGRHLGREARKVSKLVQFVHALGFGEAHQKPQLVLLADVLA